MKSLVLRPWKPAGRRQSWHISFLAILALFALASLAALAKTAPMRPVASARPTRSAHVANSLSGSPYVLDDATLRRFDSAFSQISEHSNAAIVVEGVPLLQSLDDDQLHDLKRALSGWSRLSTTQMISRVAAAYDYDSEASDFHTFLLRKRYTDPNDLPFVTYAELRRGIKSVLEFLDPDSTARVVVGKDSVFWTFYDSLTPDQIKRGRQGIPISDLNSGQRALALASGREALLHGPTFVLRWVFNELQLLQDRRVVFKWLRMPEGEAFGFEAPFGLVETIGPFPLNNGFRTSGGGAYTHTWIKPNPRSALLTAQTPLGVGDPFAAPLNGSRILTDPSNPTEIDRFLAPGMLSGRLPHTMTLSEVASKFTSSDATGSHIAVDDAIVDKPVCLYGPASTSRDHLLRGIGAVYGLAVHEGEVGKYTIALPRPRDVDRAEDASKEIARLLPAPIERYYARQTDRIEKIVHSENPTPAGGAGTRTSASNQWFIDNLKVADLARREWYFPAVRRLLVLTQPAVPTRASPPVIANSLGTEVLRLMALVLLSGDAMREVDTLGKFAPPRCLSEPDTLVVKVQMRYQPGLGQDVVNLTFGYQDGSGNFVNEGGAGGARKPNRPMDPSTADTPNPPLDILGNLPHSP